ncbi:MAG: hypothetical protein Ct9H300mP30_2150 [Methanobacteriota archaeon]|nr:MAG: hypothetical protein Ct9H300mP30_2150 [Euryarchaeota archaeon]
MLSGIVALILIPNLGDATMRIPLTRIRVPVLIGGTRFDFTSNPRLPTLSPMRTLPGPFFYAALCSTRESVRYSLEGGSGIGNLLVVDEFSRVFTLLFTSPLLLASMATATRMPAITTHHPQESDSLRRPIPR